MNEVHASSSCLPHCDYLILNTLHSLALQSQVCNITLSTFIMCLMKITVTFLFFFSAFAGEGKGGGVVNGGEH